MSLRTLAWHGVRALGGFAIARRMTRNRLRILCYHGFSITDEHEIAPVMFMRATTFERRMRILKRRGYPVLSLNDAVGRLRAQNVRDAEVVITLDDGWASTLSVAQPILERYGFAACVYVTTEHLEAGTEVFNLALSYMIRRANRREIELRGVHPALDGVYEVTRDPDAVIRKLIIAAESALPLRERQRLLRAIAVNLGFDIQQLLSNGRFRLMSAEQITELARRGMAVELHTHSHRLSAVSFEAMARDVELNRSALRALLGVVPKHFCYPSGEYIGEQPDWLARLGIASATTCDPGLNDARTPLMMLRRFLDSDVTSDIEFEAEMSGARELLRRARPGKLKFLNVRRG